MASLIEKETGQCRPADDRPVFINRLKLGMRLQTDPSVIYGLGEAFDGNLTRAHCQNRHPVQHLHLRRPAALADCPARRRC